MLDQVQILPRLPHGITHRHFGSVDERRNVADVFFRMRAAHLASDQRVTIRPGQRAARWLGSYTVR